MLFFILYSKRNPLKTNDSKPNNYFYPKSRSYFFIEPIFNSVAARYQFRFDFMHFSVSLWQWQFETRNAFKWLYDKRTRARMHNTRTIPIGLRKRLSYVLYCTCDLDVLACYTLHTLRHICNQLIILNYNCIENFSK